MSDQWTDQAAAIKQRIADDPEFRAWVESDPVEALTQAGLPEGTLRAFLRDVGIEADVSGYDFGDDLTKERGLPI